jgi:lipopolysaccharide transport system permease protein
LWPWLMLREGVGRATQAIVSNAALVGKIAFPRELLIYATVTASFLIHLAGFAVALTALAFFGDTITVAGLPSWLLLLFGWYMLALALGLVFSAVQVYWRELEHLLDSLWMLVFYATPILFSLATLPESLRTWLAFNPLSYPVSRMREVLFDGKALWAAGDLVFVLTAVVLWWIARHIFLRLEERFDDAL